MALLTEAAGSGVTVVMVTHSLPRPPKPGAPSSCSTARWSPKPCWRPEGKERHPCSATISPPRSATSPATARTPAITIAGLAIAFAAAILIGLYVRDEMSFDRWFPGDERIFLVNYSSPASGSRWTRT